MTAPGENRLGILAMCAAMALFVTNDALLKLATATLPTGQIMTVRGLFATVLAMGLVLSMREAAGLRGLRQPVVLARAGLEALVAFLYITSLAFLPLANITAILQATPIIMTLIAVAFGLERVGWRRWSAIGVGFCGVLLVVKPDPARFDVYALVALLSAAGVAVRDLITRRIGGHVPSSVVTLSTTTTVGLSGAVIGIPEVWQPLGTGQIALLAAAAAFVTAGNLCIIVAFRRADVAVVSPFRYTIVAMAIGLGYLLFGELPDLLAGAGIGLIAGSGLYTIHREQARRRLAEAAT
ncbi:DMT family transporter [Salinarimonas soli]|uniref:DMT family transporter n=1 Tax=Salinarimonas soli TaxID=1638099 RepID=A0A5B2VJ53_9HYPH|nr:DMT family transporter [Salinarimonas soli]KAA2238227.1 DMT family transporter [Salinarimonas soli]